MSRRKTEFEQFLDGLFDFLRVVPWWVGPPTILLAWLTLRFIVPFVLLLIGGSETEELAYRVCSMIAGGSRSFAVIGTLVVAAVWVMALFKKLGDGQRLEGQTGIQSIRELPWREFEQLLGEAFRRQGYAVRETPAGADGGIDLILSKAGGETLVQAKQWKAQKVSVKVARELYGVQMSRRSAGAILVTSGRFTGEAKQFAKENGMQLIDGLMLERMIAEVQRSGQVARSEAVMTAKPATAAVDAPLACPACGAAMVRRVAKRGQNAGQSFWGCPHYPTCRGTRQVV